MSKTTECPICGGNVTIDGEAVQGELLECQECGTELEVKTLDPIELAEAPQTEEDWGQ